MRSVLILDTEATGTERDARVVEVGVVLWSVQHATRIAAYSSLVDGATNPAKHVNGIPEAALADGADEAAVWERLRPWVARSDAIVAHGCEFDRKFTPPAWDQGRPWICSMDDIAWPLSTKRKLVELCLDHGLGVARAHRALTDCELVERMLERCHELGHDVEDMLRQAARPKGLFRACVSYEQRELAKASGFRWNDVLKRWERRLFEEDANAFSFRVERVG